MKLTRAVPAAIAAAVLALSGCSSPAASSPSGAPADAVADLQKAGVLKVGTEGTYAPFSFHDPQTNELTGYDIDVVTAVAGKLGVKPEFFETKWTRSSPASRRSDST